MANKFFKKQTVAAPVAKPPQSVQRQGHLVVYTIGEAEEGERGFWTRIGVAFVNRDGSLNIKLNALPVNGSMHIREPSEKGEQKQSGDVPF